MTLDEKGFPTYSRLYPGHPCEAKTLREVIDALSKARPELARNRTVILDAGMATEANMHPLKEKRFHSLCVRRTRVGGVPQDSEDLELIRAGGESALKGEVQRFKKDPEVPLLGRSSGRHEKDRTIRTRPEPLLIERLTYFRGGLKKKGPIKR